MTTEHHFPVDLFEVEDDTPVVGISANCWINAIGLSVVLWWGIFRLIGIL